jgi:hypothetical protein
MGSTKEERWLRCRNPETMLRLLGKRASGRKLRLFACACCRRVWQRIKSQRCRKAVEVAERHADQQVTDDEWRLASAAAYRAAAAADATDPDRWTVALAVSEAVNAPLRTSFMARETAAYDPQGDHTTFQVRRQVEADSQVLLLRDLFDNPFQPPSTIDPTVRSWNDGIVKLLAQAAYEERALPDGTLDPYRLAVLADALTDAGCTDAGLLEHLRGSGTHVRGCWALDLVLDKE